MIQGSNVTLSCNNTCKVEDNPTIIWWKNDEHLSVNVEHNNDLLLINVTMDDEGYYSCALKGFEEHPATMARLVVMCKYKSKQNEIQIIRVRSRGTTCILFHH